MGRVLPSQLAIAAIRISAKRRLSGRAGTADGVEQNTNVAFGRGVADRGSSPLRQHLGRGRQPVVDPFRPQWTRGEVSGLRRRVLRRNDTIAVPITFELIVHQGAGSMYVWVPPMPQ